MNAHSPLIPILIMAVTLGACAQDKAELAHANLPPLSVHVIQAEATTLQKVIEVHGVVQPARQAFVSSRVMGPVVAVKTWAGAKVSRGQILIEIQPETSKGQVAQAEGALTQAQAALALAERNLQRFENLHAEKAASEVELDMARMQHGQAKGAVDQAMGAVHTATTVAGEAGVTAPFAARVIERLVEVGDMAIPGRPLIRLESLEGRRLWLSVRETDIERLELDQKIPVTLDSRADGGMIEGTVAEIVPSADPATHTFTVKVDLGSVDVPSGISGRASIPGDTVERILIPATAVHYRGGLELVIVRADDASARTRAVTTGRALPDDRVEILSGIKAGDFVVVDAPAPVADGTPLELSR
ncbi:MAG: efflux RND transporter periplasmic adaptor subunit [Thermoanaerobaculales bacterium]|nr:efflux RND transporter periplasmic adaptor subunit [Thermoanaerobaculales bacterium]